MTFCHIYWIIQLFAFKMYFSVLARRQFDSRPVVNCVTVFQMQKTPKTICLKKVICALVCLFLSFCFAVVAGLNISSRLINVTSLLLEAFFFFLELLGLRITPFHDTRLNAIKVM